MGIWNHLRSVFGGSSKANGEPESFDITGILIKDYSLLVRLARQIHAHADGAPYPYIAKRLKEIAAEKESEAQTLKERILQMGGQPGLGGQEIRSGKNHWARMVLDAEDEKDLEDRFLDDALRIGSEAPELSDLLRKLVFSKAFHRDELQDLIAKADPQAALS